MQSENRTTIGRFYHGTAGSIRSLHWPTKTGLVAIQLLLVALSVCLGVRPADASMFEQVLHSFAPTNGAVGPGPLLEGKDGALYGTTTRGGAGLGTIFMVSKDGRDYRVLHVFDPKHLEDGALPLCRLLEATDGALYGTTQVGGITNSQNSGGFGTIFRLARDGSAFTVLYRFQGSSQADGEKPAAGLLEASDGALYGTTASGNTVFRIDKDGSNYAEVYGSFGGTGGPLFLIQATDGALYGTTSGGCIGQCGFYSGDVFTLHTDGNGFNELYCFLGYCVGDGDSSTGLVEGSDGALYGSTRNFIGRSAPVGTGETVFTLNKDGSGYNILHTFGATAGDGFSPSGGVIEGADGALYGTTTSGGVTNSLDPPWDHGAGMVYKLNKNGSGYSIVHLFPALGSGDAAQPTSLILGDDGAFYGTSDFGGAYVGGSAYGGGTVFRLSSTPLPPVLQSVTRTGAALALAWSAYAGGHYQLQYSTNLVQTNWTNLGNPVTATNSTGTASDTVGSDPHRFYRVVLVLP